MIGGLFAGDVKFLMAIGSFLGWFGTLYSAIYMALIGGVLAILNVFFRNGIKYGFGYFAYLLSLGNFKPSYLTSERIKEINKSRMPYGIAIGLGALVQIFLG
jgi:prepilin peptidase CpaA